jgi:hypothetical protein
MRTCFIRSLDSHMHATNGGVIAEVWDLPDDSMLQPTGTDWPIHFLHALT